MYGYQVVFEDPKMPKQRVVLQLLSDRRHSSVVELLRAEGLLSQYRDWSLVDFRTSSVNAPAHPKLSPATTSRLHAIA